MRRQYFIDSYRFKDIKEKDDKLIFNENDKVSYSISENFLFKKLYEITGTEYKEQTSDPYGLGEQIKLKSLPQDNPLDGMFILKANTVKKDEMNDLYNKAIRDGIYIGDKHYLYSEKSASMIRTQRTVFIQEKIKDKEINLKDKIIEYLTLGKKCDKCVTAKWLTTSGYLLSSVDIVNLLPRIVVIPDFEKSLNKNVYIMENYTPTDEENKQLVKEKEFNDELKEYKKEKAKCLKLFTEDYLLNRFHRSAIVKDNIKSMSGWEREGRRVMQEELSNPCSFYWYKDITYWATYSRNQTEEWKPEEPTVKPYMVGKNKVHHENYPCGINCFDGEGIMSMDFANKLKEALNVPYDINSIQMRLPFIKANVVRVDWKNWMLEHGMEEIQPMSFDGRPVRPVKITDIDIIITESCFKAKLEKAEGKNPWLFSSMEEYYNLLKKYNYTYFDIANHSEPHFDNEYNQITYQIINSTSLNLDDLKALSAEEINMLDKVKNGDIAATKIFLNIIAHKTNDGEFDEEEETDYSDLAKVYEKVISLDENFVYDKQIQKFVQQRCDNFYEDLLIGRILIPSQFLVATGDVIAFMEWAAWRKEDKVKGFLKGDYIYCNGKTGDYVVARYPQTHFSELSIHKFIEDDDKYIKHLNNVIQCSIYSSIMFRKNLDFDGDKLYIISADLKLSEGRTFRDVIINDDPIFNPDDKKTTNATKFNTDAILKFEHLNMDNKTGQVTNLNSIYQTLALKNGDLKNRDFGSSLCKALQGEIIDSVKKGNEVNIPKPLKDGAVSPENLLKGMEVKKPYFMMWKYGGEKKKYLDAMSPLDLFSKYIYKAYINVDDEGNKIKKEKHESPDIRKMMDDEIDNDIEITLLKELIPIFNSYCKQRGEIAKEGRFLNRLSSNEDDKEKQKEIKQEYADLYADTRQKVFKAYKNKIGQEINEQILASICVEIDYNFSIEGCNGFTKNKSYNFPWIICPRGIIANLQQHENAKKTLIINNKKDFDKSKDVISYLGREYQVTLEIKKLNLPEVFKNNKSEIAPLKDYKCSLVYCSGKEAAKKLDNKTATIKLKDDKYWCLYQNDDVVASIAKQDTVRLSDGTGQDVLIKNYAGADVKVEVEKVSNKSLKVKLNSLN